jgi:hypothetical protein
MRLASPRRSIKNESMAVLLHPSSLERVASRLSRTVSDRLSKSGLNS